jgi:hypothetical protein
MNTTRKAERDGHGVFIVALTPEEAAKWDELSAALEHLEVALRDATHDARQALYQVRFFKKYREAIRDQLRPLHRIKFPEFPLKQSIS